MPATMATAGALAQCGLPHPCRLPYLGFDGKNVSGGEAQTKASSLYFLFSSTGGSVDAGVTLYNFLRALPAKIVMHNVGSIDSIANVIFLAADERYATPHASFLYHGVTWGFSQDERLSWTQLQETVSRFKNDEAKMIGIIMQRTTITEEELRQLMHQGETKDLTFASQKGIIQTVKEAKIPEGAPFVAMNFT